MQVFELLADVSLVILWDLLLLATIGAVFRQAFSNVAAGPYTNWIIFLQYGFLIILCAVIHELHHTPFLIIFVCALSVLWRILTACSKGVERAANYMNSASKKLMYWLDPDMPTRQLDKDAGRQAVPQDPAQPHPSPSYQQQLDPLPTSPRLSQKSTSDRGSEQSTPSSNRTPAPGYTPSSHDSPSRDNDVLPGYVPKPTRPSSTLFSRGWNDPRKPQNTVSQLIPGRPPVKPSSTYTLPPGHTPYAPTCESDTLLGYIRKGAKPQITARYTSLTKKEPTWSSPRPQFILSSQKFDEPKKRKVTFKPTTGDTAGRFRPGHHPGAPSSSYITPTGHTPSIIYTPTRDSDTLLGYVLKTTPTQSRIPKATYPTLIEPTWSSWHTRSIHPHMTFNEPKKSILIRPQQVSHHNKPQQASHRNKPQPASHHNKLPSASHPNKPQLTSDHGRHVTVENLISKPPGIPNQGNACFFNSCIQCLSWTGGYLEIIERAPSDDNGLIHALATTMRQCQDRKVEEVDPWPLLTVLSQQVPRNLVTAVREEQRQQDASELLEFLLNAVHRHYIEHQQLTEEYWQNRQERLTRLEGEHQNLIDQTMIAKTNDMYSYRDAIFRLLQATRHKATFDNSAVYDLCSGQMVTVTVCQNCQKVSFNSILYMLLLLPVPNQLDNRTISLTDMFDALSGEENLLRQCPCRGDNCHHKQYCLLGDPLPQKLILVLERFKVDGALGDSAKLHARISFPVAGLDLTPFHVETGLYEPGTPMPAQLYDLTAICVHRGETLQSGHYIAYCKLSPSEQWYRFDDHIVTPVDIREIASEDVERNAYILFYSKRVY